MRIMSDSYYLRIQRFDSTLGNKPYFVTYEVPKEDPEFSPMTALKALHYINRYLEPLAYDYNCRRGTCGRCAMMIDGIPRLACYFELSDRHTIEPLAECKVVRDLIVDKSPFVEKFSRVSKEIEPDESCTEATPISGEFWRDTIHPINACRECMCCYADCQALYPGHSDSYLGPGAMQQLYLRFLDDVDPTSRIKQAFEGGLFECTQCGLCSLVCPARINCAENIKVLMDAARAQGYQNE